MQLIVLADDCTGALDTAGALCAQGYAAQMLPEMPAVLPTTPQVLSVSLNTRHVCAQAAYNSTLRAAQQVKATGAQLFLKTDSVLRGNPGAALRAVQHAYGTPIAFVPAFPQAGRVVKDGVLYVQGVPAAQSSFAHDPRNPLTKSTLDALLGFPCVRGSIGCPPLCGITCYEAQNEAELSAVAAGLAAGRYPLAGCAGFAAHLPRLLGALTAHTLPCAPLHKGLLVLSGSVAAPTLQQLAHSTLPTVRYQGQDAATLAEILQHAGGNILVATALTPADIQSPQVGEHLQQELAEAGGTLAQSFAGVIAVFGGDLLQKFLRSAQLDSVQILSQVQSCVILARAQGAGGGCWLISKSGGLGEAQILQELEARYTTCRGGV